MNSSDDIPACRELTRLEEQALQPITIHVEGLPDHDIARVDQEARTMFTNSVVSFFRQFHRPPNDIEAEELANIVARHCNEHVIPPMRAHASGSIH